MQRPKQTQKPNENRLLWRVLIIGTMLSVLGFAISVIIISQGSTNPPHANNQFWYDEHLIWINQPISTAPQKIPTESFTLSVDATIPATQQPLAAWGIWLETESGEKLVLAINGYQYVTARRCANQIPEDITTCSPLTEPTQKIQTFWKTFRFIRPIAERNQIRLNFSLQESSSNKLSLWLNDEWMWDIPYQPKQDEIRWGIWTTDNTIIHWHHAEIWLG